MKRPVYAAAVSFIITLAISHLRSTPYNNYVLLADALLHGHTWITWPGPYIDALAYNGMHYVIEAPMPAILMMGPVAAFGTAANQTLVAVLMAAVATGAAWAICERLDVPLRTTAWLVAFLLAGTDLLWCAMLGDVWFIAHVCAVAFTLLAIAELLGERRGWLVALWAACAAESRFTMAVALPVYLYLLCFPVNTDEAVLDSNWRRKVVSFAGVTAAWIVAWAGYNEARWGTLGDIGYTQWYHQDQAGLPEGSPFRLMYLREQLYSFFVRPPDFTNRFPFAIPSMLGTALTWTSPALLLAFFAKRPKRLAVAMWIAAALTAIPNFLYYVNGFAQFGMRHALDFIPFLFVLMALAVRDRLQWWHAALMSFSIVVGIWGCWYWNTFIRTT